ncbi:hypothetical protein ACJMK2_035601 [Sinanodonta woodiana]|uniref:CCHC-type domain-containing protein n=1 Tax=Sinanodonta woodiana TaxID=1069815 RepID=A0ABD3WZH3_SINWO
MIIDPRIHWLPLYIHDDIIREVLGPFGKVLDITQDTTILDKDNVTLYGTRLLKLQTTEFDSKNIPHIISLGQCGMLNTIKGWAPICLKCRQSGHLRKDYPEKSTNTYASVTRTNKPSQTSNPVPQASSLPCASGFIYTCTTRAFPFSATNFPGGAANCHCGRGRSCKSECCHSNYLKRAGNSSKRTHRETR